MLPCEDALEWIINHADRKNCLINDEQGKCVGTFLPLEISKYYNILEIEFLFNTNFVTKFHGKHDVRKIMVSWCKEYKRYFNQSLGW